jgi:streptogramin lyase
MPARIRTTFFLSLALMASADFSALTAHAQTAQFVAAQSVIPSTGLSYPYRVAVDGSGSVYISDPQANSVLKETLAPDSTYTESVVASAGLATPYGVAVDAGGHVYVVDNGNNRVLIETPSVGRYVQTVMSTSPLYDPTGLTVDSAGNVYIADTGNGRILKETPSGGSFTETVVSSAGLPQIVGIAVDSSGNVFVSDIDNMAIYEETLVAGSYVQSTVPTSGLNYLSKIFGVTSFSVTGMPAGATYVFTPSSFPTNSAGGPVSLVVQTTGVAAGLNRARFPLDNGHPGIFSTALLALLCMPVLGLFWLRKKPLQTSSALAVALFTVLLVGVVLGIVSCSNNSQSTTPQSASYPLVVTATGGWLQHSTNATLNVQN